MCKLPPLKSQEMNTDKEEKEKPQKDANVTKDDQQFVIPDECGDTLWDAVLKQEEEKDRIKNGEEKK
jgi:hypothetical protein